MAVRTRRRTGRRPRRRDSRPLRHGHRRANQARRIAGGGDRRGAPRVRQRRARERGDARDVGRNVVRASRPGRALHVQIAASIAGIHRRRRADVRARDRRQHDDVHGRERHPLPAARVPRRERVVRRVARAGRTVRQRPGDVRRDIRLVRPVAALVPEHYELRHISGDDDRRRRSDAAQCLRIVAGILPCARRVAGARPRLHTDGATRQRRLARDHQRRPVERPVRLRPERGGANVGARRRATDHHRRDAGRVRLPERNAHLEDGADLSEPEPRLDSASGRPARGWC